MKDTLRVIDLLFSKLDEAFSNTQRTDLSEDLEFAAHIAYDTTKRLLIDIIKMLISRKGE